jgi:hypothetical protein
MIIAFLMLWMMSKYLILIAKLLRVYIILRKEPLHREVCEDRVPRKFYYRSCFEKKFIKSLSTIFQILQQTKKLHMAEIIRTTLPLPASGAASSSPMANNPLTIQAARIRWTTSRTPWPCHRQRSMGGSMGG